MNDTDNLNSTTMNHQPPQPTAQSQATRDAALSVLMDREILMLRALTGMETLPQVRRHFIAKFMVPDPDVEPDPGSGSGPSSDWNGHHDHSTSSRSSSYSSSSAVRRDRYIIVNPGGRGRDRNTTTTNPETTTAISLQRNNIIDVHQVDDTGWYRPVSRSVSGSGSASSSPPPSSSSSPWKKKGGRPRMRKRDSKFGGVGGEGGGMTMPSLSSLSGIESPLAVAGSGR